MRHHWGDPEGYRAAIAREVAIRNADFDTPLGVTELGHISTSITDWTIRYSRMWNDGPAAYDQAFRAIQAARGRKGSGRNGGLAGSGRNGGLAGSGRNGGLVRGVRQALERRQRLVAIEQKGL
ncbi:hypothetical protein Ae706Ps2_6666c [Pseudonocardia sp. Ae706_Ps2]|nr:hypothetical protein [Pseudonocardia sp. Ae706_Ps2]OLM08809.1 hypothetical protein Ae706Ps2_6654c [Pseudonocardia sp. Ae706_Ps2]OLM08821.1 hypothetical protein Ae706Ps2_6666c [Pseudonocardia sp. Ae706_Ps2]